MAIFNAISAAFGSVKDKAVAASAKALINRKIERFGTVTDLEIDTQNKTLRGQLELKGEATGILISVGRYELSEENGVTWITFWDFRASREWIANLLNDCVAGRKFQTPEVVKMAL